MPGSGWNITDTSLEEIIIPGNKTKKIKAIKLILEKGINKQVVLYWFQSRGRFIASEYWQKIYLVWDAIFKNRTDGSFVRLITSVNDKGVESATESLKSFAVAVIPILNEYIPGE
jgi:EpsI family protein